MPPNELNPHTLGEHAQALAGELDHLKAEVLGPRELDKLGMGALSAVGRGSRNEPRLIVLRYDPPSATHEDVLLRRRRQGDHVRRRRDLAEARRTRWKT